MADIEANNKLDNLNAQFNIMQRQMNVFFNNVKGNGTPDLKDFHDTSKKKINGSQKTPLDFKTESLYSTQRQTNEHLSRLVKISELVNVKRDSKTSMLNAPGLLGNFVSKLGNKYDADQRERTLLGVSLRTIGKTLNAPGNGINAIKGFLQRKELKKIEKGRTSFNLDKELLAAKQIKLQNISKDKSVSKDDIKSLRNDILRTQSKLTQDGAKLASLIQNAQTSRELILNKKRFGNLGEDDRNTIADAQKNRIEKSLLGDLSKPRRVGTRRGFESQIGIGSGGGDGKQFTSLIGNIDTHLKDIKRSIGGNPFDKSVNISGSTPKTIGDTIGSIYYKISHMSESKKEDSGSDSNGLLGALGGLLAGALPFLLGKFKGLAKMGEGLLKLLSKSGGLLNGLMKGIGGAKAKLLKFIPGLLSKGKALITGTKAGTTAAKVGAKIAKPVVKGTIKAGAKVAAGVAAKKIGTQTAAKVGGKTIAKLGGKAVAKSAAKKIPVLGAGIGAVFAAQRAISGDYTGAGLELTSGLASIIPGLGTAASLGIDAAILARDIKRERNKDLNNKPKEEPKKPYPNKTEINPVLTGAKEISRSEKEVAMEFKLQEDAVYNALEKHASRDMQTRQPERSRNNAQAMLDSLTANS